MPPSVLGECLISLGFSAILEIRCRHLLLLRRRSSDLLSLTPPAPWLLYQLLIAYSCSLERLAFHPWPRLASKTVYLPSLMRANCGPWLTPGGTGGQPSDGIRSSAIYASRALHGAKLLQVTSRNHIPIQAPPASSPPLVPRASPNTSHTHRKPPFSLCFQETQPQRYRVQSNPFA